MENGKDNIIRRIAEDTDERVKQILAEGEAQAERLKADAEKASSAEREKAEAKLVADSAELLRRASVNAEMNGRKYMLGQKQKLVSDVFDEVQKQILAMPRAKYASLMEKLLQANAEKGEKLVFAKADADVFTNALASKYGVELATEYGNFEGGFVLVGNGYEKNVTIGTIVGEARLNCESQVVKIIFDGE